MSRTNYTVKNIAYNYLNMLIGNILSFVNRSIFIYALGATFLGLNGLFTNILSMLSMAELGIGAAINYSLYKPLALNDIGLVSKLMSFYKSTYRIIGAIVAGFGIIIIPFLKYFIKGAENIDNLYIMYLLFLADAVSSYYLTYKTTLIYADQKTYKLIPTTIKTAVVSNILQVIVLLLYKDFLIYLTTKIIMSFLQRYILNRFITKMYKYINFRSREKIPQQELSVIKRNIAGIMIGRIGDFCINGTDNIVIAAYINVQTVGIYSNYYMIISLVQQLISLIFSSTTASLGNLMLSDNKQKRIETFNIMNFIAFWIFGWTMICLLILSDNFVFIWIGKEYLISKGVLLIVLINYYLVGMRIPLGTILIAGGVNYPGRYMGLVQSAVNLIVTITLVKSWGLIGVFIGTLVSSITVASWVRPYLAYKYILESSVKEYFKNFIIYTTVIIIACSSTYVFCNITFVKFTWVNLIFRAIACLLIPNVIFILMYRKTHEFKRSAEMAREIIKKCKNIKINKSSVYLRT